jgi:hypothetical protein
LIVEQEQQGNERAQYGKRQLQSLLDQLRAELGKGFDTRNLPNMRAFCQVYQNGTQCVPN